MDRCVCGGVQADNEPSCNTKKFFFCVSGDKRAGLINFLGRHDSVQPDVFPNNDAVKFLPNMISSR